MEVGAKKIFGIVLAGLTLIQAAWAGETIRLRRGLVIPVRFQDELSLRENRRGDRFTAIVDEDRDLPYGTVLQGHVEDIERATEKRSGFMDLQFDSLIFPDGTRQPLEAVPIRMDDKTIKRGSDGRLSAKKKLEDTSKYIVGGMVGGYLIGRILGDKHAEGIMLGALAGILMGETERNSTANEIVVKRDSRMGALIKRDISVEVNGDTRYGREDRDSRSGRYIPNDIRQPNPADDLVIEYHGKALRFSPDLQPFREGETWMVPLEATAKQLDMTVDDNHSRRIYVEDDDTVLILEQESRNYRLNGKRAELPQSVAVRDEVVYVPIDALLAAKSGQIRINRTQS